MTYSAILFDLDGTLVDTISLWQEAYLSTLRSEGIDMDMGEFMARIYSGNAHFNTVFAELGFPEDEWQRIRKKRDDKYCKLLSTKAKWMDGAEDFLDQIRKKYPIGMMTGSWKSYVDAMDKPLDVYSKFKATVTCDETQNGRSKPKPDGLLLLAEKMEVDPKSCIYIGDQPFDIDASNSAGMTSCLLWQEWTPAGIEGAKIEVKDYEELIGLLEI